MDVKNELLDYINRNESTGALLLTGKWGCGKSYLVKKVAKELNDEQKAAVAVISLFGLDNVAAVNKRVKDEYNLFVLGSLGKVNKNLSRLIGKFVQDGMAVVRTLSGGNPAVVAASQGVSAAMNYDFLSFIEIKNTVGDKDKQRKFVIVFDDLERSNIKQTDLLGVMNEYVENKQIKVIIVADEKKIDGEKYKEYKEKLISRTIKMSADYESLISNIISSYTETEKGYRQFLEDNKELLQLVFVESKSDNLRILKYGIADFERVYAAWKKTGIATTNMKWALYTFVAEVFMSKKPEEQNRNPDTTKGVNMLFSQEDKQYINKGKNNSLFSSLNAWIYHGEWDEESFCSELTARYVEIEMTPLERFLGYHVFALQQRDIDEGLPTALTLGYEGKLEQDDLISLLQKVHFLKENGFQVSCEVDYKKLEKGFAKREILVKQGRINDAKRRTFTTLDAVDSEAKPLWERIESLDDRKEAWKNRRKFISYICAEDISSRYLVSGMHIDEFDDELLGIFEKRFFSVCNEEKREYALSLLGLVFDSRIYSNKENIERTKRNFKKLIKDLEMQDTTDSITKFINREFVKEVKALSIMKEEEY